MKDLHSHLCYGIDDGCRTLEESISILKKMSKEGYTDVFLTPHYMEDTKYVADNKTKLSILANLKQACIDENININLYLGNEVYLTDNVVNLIKKGEIMPLNNSKYILMEFSLYQKDPNIRSILHNVMTNGYIPVIAHPERYAYVGKKMEFIKELKDMGVLFQGNYLSLFGKYGKEAKKNLQKMLKDDIISFIGSDIHHDDELHSDKIYKDIKKCVKKDSKVEDILYNNINYIIKDK